MSSSVPVVVLRVEYQRSRISRPYTGSSFQIRLINKWVLLYFNVGPIDVLCLTTPYWCIRSNEVRAEDISPLFDFLFNVYSRLREEVTNDCKLKNVKGANRPGGESSRI